MLIFKIILYLILSIIGIIIVWNKQELPIKKKIGASLGVLIILSYFFLPSKDKGSTKTSNSTSTNKSNNAFEKNGTYSGNNVSLTIYDNNWDCELNDGGPSVNSSGILIGNSLYVVDENGKTNVGYVNSTGVTLTMGGHLFLKKQ